MPNTVAVSSVVKPPKKRSSMIWLLRGSSSARLFKASSSARISTARPAAISAAALSETCCCAPPRLSRCRARVIDQDLPHQPRRNAEKVRATLPGHGLLHQAQIGFVEQRRSLQRMTQSLVTQVMTCQPAQLFVDERNQPVARRCVARTPSEQQLCDLLCRRLRHQHHLVRKE